MVLVLFWSSVFVVTNETHTHLTQWILISGHLSYLIWTWYACDKSGVWRLGCIGLGAHASRTLVLVLLWSSVFVVTNKTHTHLTQWILISGHLSYLIWTWYA